MRRTKEDAEKTRLKVLEAALKLFSQHGYSHTTFNMIAREAGFSRGPIYWHFRNKDELYEAVIDVSQGALKALVHETLEEVEGAAAGIDHFVRRWLALLVEDRWYRQSFEILLNKSELTSELAPTLKRERGLTRSIIGMFTTLIERARQEGELPSGAAPGEMGLLCYTYLMGITQTWLFAPRLFSLKAEAPFFRAQLWRLLNAGPGDAPDAGQAGRDQ